MTEYIVFVLLLITVICVGCVSAQDVDGSWSPWSKYPTPCSKPCGDGRQNLTRSCSNPVRQGNGKDCVGNATEEHECNTDACKTHWSQWSECDVKCDVGARNRHTLCGDRNCSGSQYELETEECVDWNKNTCPSPCLKDRCPEYGKCSDTSNDTRPMFKCTCVMGYQMNKYNKCARPPPPPPTPRPIPTMSPVDKTIAIVITRTASTILLIMVGLTLGLFAALRIFTADRIIEMNMEIALECSHLVLLFPNTMAEDNPITCRILSIALHYFFTACFMFIFLESVHMYTLVAFVVQRNGLLSPLQNVLTGWGLPVLVLLFSICFHYDEYGGQYHCWLQMDTLLIYAQFVPIVVLLVLTFTMTEAAGNADYKPLENVDFKQLFSAKISQRSNVILMCLIFVSWILGVLSDYEQNLALYSAFSILNAIIGFYVFFSHSLGNQEVRRKLKQLYGCCKNKMKRK